jgi:phosphate starvation-inducible protein PhoH and related proteins
MSSKRKRSKKLSDEELMEVENFVYSKNMEEDKFLQSIRIHTKCKNENQKTLVNSIKQNEISIVSGLPGTGKTFLACAEALKLIKNTVKYKKILLIKSITPLPGEDLGFLPGDMDEKMEPFMISFIDNFEKIIGESLTRKLRELGLIKIQPLTYIRGRSIDNTIIIVDEAQNITVNNMRSLMTRIGDDSKLVILGDTKQKDLGRGKESSLEIILEKFKGIEGFGSVELRDPKDVVRNPIIQVIEKTFDEIEDEKVTVRGPLLG